MRTVKINLYSFGELSGEAKKTAINEHAEFLASLPIEEDDNGEPQDVYGAYTDNDVIDNIEANDYLFFEDGELANCVTYVEKHPKAGITEFKFHGRIYDITQ